MCATDQNLLFGLMFMARAAMSASDDADAGADVGAAVPLPVGPDAAGGLLASVALRARSLAILFPFPRPRIESRLIVQPPRMRYACIASSSRVVWRTTEVKQMPDHVLAV